MNRSVPLWLVLFLGLLGCVFTVLVAWSVKESVRDNRQDSFFQRLLLEVAGFPSLVIQVFGEVEEYATADYQDSKFVVQRDIDIQSPDFREVVSPAQVSIAGVYARVSGEPVPGWRLLSGAFLIDGTVEHAALLMNRNLQIQHLWRLVNRSSDPKAELRPPHRIFPHGVLLLQDGSLIYAFDGGSSIQRIDSCGNSQWVTDGKYSHTANLDESGTGVWTIRQSGIANLSIENGMERLYLSTEAIAAANPDIDIFGMRREEVAETDPNQRNIPSAGLIDATHLNDADPLLHSLTTAFPMFDAGDVLVSSRSLNTLFVVDPVSAKVKWWRTGAYRRQHDPDWMQSGEILVFDNRMGLDSSRIVAIDPKTNAVRTLLDGDRTGFFSRIRGKVQYRDDGSLIVTSPQQGHAFETDAAGRVVLDLVNAKPGSSAENYLISELKWYSQDGIDTEGWKCSVGG